MSQEGKGKAFKNIMEVITSPVKVMNNIEDNPRIWSYWIVITVIELLVILVEMPKIVGYTILNAQQSVNLSQSAISFVKISAVISGIITALIGPALTVLILSVFIKVITSILKEKGNFKKLYCVNLIAYVPIVISNILTAVVMIFTEAQNIKNISTSFAVFLNSSTNTFIYKLLSHIDIFYIWSIILSSIGTSAVFKISMKKALIINFGIYILSVIIMILV